MVRGVSQERLGPSYFFISLVLVPLNSLVWYVPSSRFISVRTNKRHHHQYSRADKALKHSRWSKLVECCIDSVH